MTVATSQDTTMRTELRADRAAEVVRLSVEMVEGEPVERWGQGGGHVELGMLYEAGYLSVDVDVSVSPALVRRPVRLVELSDAEVLWLMDYVAERLADPVVCEFVEFFRESWAEICSRGN